jgi:hypothetical protein
MDISRWHHDTSLLALSLSIDSALRSKGESPSEVFDKHLSRRLRLNKREDRAAIARPAAPTYSRRQPVQVG